MRHPLVRNESWELKRCFALGGLQPRPHLGRGAGIAGEGNSEREQVGIQHAFSRRVLGAVRRRHSQESQWSLACPSGAKRARHRPSRSRHAVFLLARREAILSLGGYGAEDEPVYATSWN